MEAARGRTSSGTRVKGSDMAKIKGYSWKAAAGALTLALGLGATAPASAADECITKAAKDAISACPGGKLQISGGKKPAVSFKSAPQCINLKKKDDAIKPTNPTASMNAAQRD